MYKCVLLDEDHNTVSSREMSPSFTMGRDSPVVIEAQDMEESQRRGNFCKILGCVMQKGP